MQLSEVLERIEARLKILNMTENAASQAAGKPDAIRNLRRGVKSGARKGISTATLAALAPILKTSAEWLLTGRNGPEAEETAEEAAVSLPYADAILALTLAFEALRLGIRRGVPRFGPSRAGRESHAAISARRAIFRR